MKPFIALAIHAEQLHNDRVWNRLAPVARWMNKKGIQATFFVYPFRGEVRGISSTRRVQALAALGHEISQHTHFYAGARTELPDKVNDLSEANIVHCLQRDFKTLQAMGLRPRGFTAGAWIVNDTVLDGLVELGFAYDCSARLPSGKMTTDSVNQRWLSQTKIYASPKGSLLCLPTVCSLGEWFKWGRKTRVEGLMPYQLVYVHDYDLLSLHKYLLLWCWCFLALAAGRRCVSTSTLMSRLLDEDVDG